MAATRPVERLERSWEDAARLAGASPFRIWRSLSWPLIRPAAMRAASLVFLFALVEPGAPLILGLRRTLAFQIVESAGRSDPFPPAAVWALMAGLYGWAGSVLLRWRAGPAFRGNGQADRALARNGSSARRASPIRALASALVLAISAVVAWLPAIGLVHLAAGPPGSAGRSADGQFRAVIDQLGRIARPPVPRLAANSVIFGLEAACVIMALAWIVRPEDGNRPWRTSWWRVLRPMAKLPPLVLGAGVLALPWLAELAARSIDGAGHRSPGLALSKISAALDPSLHPWILMGFAIVLALAPRCFASWRDTALLEPARMRCRSATEAALLTGVSRARARGFGALWLPGRWSGRFVLVWALAATNLAPALFFAPWTDWKTVAPAVIVLARGDGDARAQAAVLALGVLVVNVGALGVARLTKSLPGSVDLD
jgi:ABC-type Fe3+ transport system permease subunit